MNWTSARDQCRRFGLGYDIASIEDLYEQGTMELIFTSKSNENWNRTFPVRNSHSQSKARKREKARTHGVKHTSYVTAPH